MTPRVRRGCPRQEAASQKLASRSLVPLSNDLLDDLAKEIDGSFVLVVKLSGGKYRRRCFLTVATHKLRDMTPRYT
jgi:hypothetical protein